MAWRDQVEMIQRNSVRQYGERQSERIVVHLEDESDVELAGIFDRDFVERATETEYPVSAVETFADVVEADLPRRPRQGNDSLTVPRLGVRFRIKRVDDDGLGMLSLALSTSRAR